MQFIKYLILFLILIFASIIGKLLSRKYVYRLAELEEMSNALNIFKTKIKFTYEPIPEIFKELSENMNTNIANIFKNANNNMENLTANISWEHAINNTETNLKDEDKYVLKTLSKLLGQTDVEGQISQIEITEKFLENQIEEAQQEKTKNEKLYSKLGTTIGLVIVIILF